LAAKTAVGSAAAPGQIGYIDMVDGERRLPNAIDVAQASGASTAQAAEAALPVSAQAAAGTPIVTGNAGDDTIDGGHGGNVLFGGAGADNFVFGPNIQLNAATPAQITHVADYRLDRHVRSALRSGHDQGNQACPKSARRRPSRSIESIAVHALLCRKRWSEKGAFPSAELR
jgi:hypothetical protein